MKITGPGTSVDIIDYIPPREVIDDYRALSDLLSQVVSGRLAEVRDTEVLLERPDGSRVTVVVNIRPQTNQPVTPRGHLAPAE